ncbi:PQQ-binding-like beta-propeller repeat protein [Planctomicrobium sp.]|jgi:outer membrane protein assembly factor BamB|nr:PQQ-binding-like beta-propeller repeat protein [Planctomicrobium sp.]MBT5020223.1 PQQ-binding-like beta-propeller repeat protein [Planctomicrobium sp.]MDB4743892.1 PQQ-binding-like beta-propeller repeat protein [Planctomicrobium sp.]
MRSLLPLMTLCLLATYSDCHAGNWAHWRGPSGNSVAENANPPLEWSDTKNVKWKVAVPGQGSGSPIIWEDQVFVMSAVPVEATQRRTGRGAPLPELEFKIFCIDRDSGKVNWEKTATVATPHEGTHSTNPFSSASPCTDGKHVYAHFGSRGLYCYTMDGELVWKKTDFGKMESRNGFGEGSSPTIAGDKIIVPWDHQGASYITALNKLTGDSIWKTPREEPTSWYTPLIIDHAGTEQVITNGENYARSYDLETGEELWRCSGQTQRPVASPLYYNGLVYIGSGHRGSFLAAFDPSGRGDLKGTDKVVWSVSRDTPDIASPLVISDRLYFYKAKSGLLSCVDAATGKPFYTTARIPELEYIYASPVAAGGHLYLTDRSGTTVVIKDSEKLEIVATNSVGETVDATPAPVDNQLFIRGAKHLFCIEK